MSKIDTEILDLTSAKLAGDDDTLVTLDNYARGFISKTELADRLEFLLMVAKERAERIVLGPAECDTGVTDRSDMDEERRNFQADQMEHDGDDAA